MRVCRRKESSRLLSHLLMSFLFVLIFVDVYLLWLSVYVTCDHVSGGNAPLLLLLFNGDPVDITFAQLSPKVDAIVSCVYPAQATGEALYRMITMTGPHSIPAARLPNTWPAVLHQVIVETVNIL